MDLTDSMKKAASYLTGKPVVDAMTSAHDKVGDEFDRLMGQKSLKGDDPQAMRREGRLIPKESKKKKKLRKQGEKEGLRPEASSGALEEMEEK